jgi:hypothetical protein
MGRIAVGIAVVPSRGDTLHHVVQSMEWQECDDFDVHVFLCGEYRRFGAGFSQQDADALADRLGVSVHIVEDFGPLTKLAGLLIHTKAERLVTADDDCSYSRDWLSHLARLSERHSENAVGLRGRRFGSADLSYCKSVIRESERMEKDEPVDLVTGVGGWCYRRDFFGDDFLERWRDAVQSHPYVFFNDDIWISGYLANKGIKRMVGAVKYSASQKGEVGDFAEGQTRSFGDHVGEALCHTEQQVDRTNRHIQYWRDSWRTQ